jgi:Tfp pilus assembly protein PilF
MQEILDAYQRQDLVTTEVKARQLLAAEPDHLQGQQALGVVLASTQRHSEAIPFLRRVVALSPRFAEGWCNLGSALQESQQLDEALQCYQKALDIDPNYADAHFNLTLGLNICDRFDQALQHARAYAQLKPERSLAYYNLGFVLRRLNRLEEAIAAYRRAVELEPSMIQAHKNLGHCLLLSGLMIEGFSEYEWRWQQPHWQGRDFAQPLWQGQDIAGKTMLVHAEQGFGDTLQFVRYLPQLKALGCQVVLECQEPLLRLLEPLPGVDAWVSQSGGTLPAFDYHIPLLSLPHRLLTRLESIPNPGAYVSVQHLGPATFPLAPTPSLKIGLVWGGNPEHQNDRYRSCGFEVLRPLVQHFSSAQFYSLQKGPAAEQFPPDLPVIDLAEHLHDFADTAQAIAQLDLVITVDTSVAHLAGALGKPVWTLLTYSPDWRWMLHRTDSPWYPSMRLFRQSSTNDWQSVLTPVYAALEQLIAQRDQEHIQGGLTQRVMQLEQQVQLLSAQIQHILT